MIIPYERLKDEIYRVFMALGCSAANAEKMARCLVTADARGVYSHGIQMVPFYAKWLREGAANIDPHIRVLKESKTGMMVDGDGGLGGIVFTDAVDLAIAKAKKEGSANLIMINGDHYGAGAYYVERAAEQGLIAYLYGNTIPLAAPFGGAERYFGTNPYSFAAPAGKYGSLVLDMATTVTAFGKINAAIADKVEVPPTFGVDSLGRPTTNPSEILNGGALRHFGDAKGYGIAFMIDVMTGVLSGSTYKAADLLRDDHGNPHKTPLSFFMNLIDISAFMDPQEFEVRMEDLIGDIKSTRPAEGFREVCYPGEIENNNLRRAMEEGIQVHEGVYEVFARCAQELGVKTGGGNDEEKHG